MKRWYKPWTWFTKKDESDEVTDRIIEIIGLPAEDSMYIFSNLSNYPINSMNHYRQCTGEGLNESWRFIYGIKSQMIREGLIEAPPTLGDLIQEQMHNLNK